jgi:formylglycine-generating enzyme required for sulfatase activity
MGFSLKLSFLSKHKSKIMNLRIILIITCLAVFLGACQEWTLDKKCVDSDKSISVSTSSSSSTFTIGELSATWSLVNASGQTIKTNTSQSFVINSLDYPNGDYIVKAHGVNSCGFTFDLQTSYSISNCSDTSAPSNITINTNYYSVSCDIGAFSANWSLVNPEGQVVVSSLNSKTFDFNIIYANGNYTIKAVGKNACNIGFSLEKNYTIYQTIDMVYVQGGSFQMGSNDGEVDEKPIHSVTLSDFYIGKFEITQAQWKLIMGNNPSNFSNCDNCPVEQVSWNDAQKFITILNQKTGKTYRLPTEAEWEYAARGGQKSKGYIYSGSNNIFDVGWMDANSNFSTHPVGQKQMNELGIYDMTGNVWEWCQDLYGVYPTESQTNPKGSGTGTDIVTRGGGWSINADPCRVANRANRATDFVFSAYGFRLALVP